MSSKYYQHLRPKSRVRKISLLQFRFQRNLGNFRQFVAWIDQNRSLCWVLVMKTLILLLPHTLVFYLTLLEVSGACAGNETTKATNDDEVLARQIAAMDRFVTGHLLNNKQLPPPEFNSTEFPDMSMFRQIYELGQDKIKIFGICNACNVAIGYLMFKVRVVKTDLADMEAIAIFICDYFRIATGEVCRGGVERYAPVMHFIMKEREMLSPKSFCGTILQSHGCTVTDPSLDWTVDIPPEPEVLNRQVTRLREEKPTGLLKIVQLTDLHIDPHYEPGMDAVCDNKILCCQRRYGRPPNKFEQAGFFGDSRRCDTPQMAFEMTLEHIAKEHGDMDFLYMNGDLVPHNVWSTSIEENSKIIQKSAATIAKYFPNTTIIPLIGNHEPHPVNFFSPYGVPPELDTTWVYKVSYEAFKQWIPDDQAESYKQFGSYFVEVNPNFRLLIYNSNFCYEFNMWQMYEPKDPGNQLQWLINELQKSEERNQFVHIIGHVPPGHEECYHVWSRNFYEIVKRYHKIIKGQFYGHTHFDEFKIFYKDGQPVNAMWIAPSLTPYEVHNLMYRVYFADPNDYAILDHETWTYDLKKENDKYMDLTEKGRNTRSVDWFRLYNITSAYGIPDARPESLHLLVDKLATDPHTFKNFLKVYYKSLYDGYKQEKCNSFCKKRLLCGFVRYHKTYHDFTDECNRIFTLIDSS